MVTAQKLELAKEEAKNAMKHVILDTDIWGDADDALATWFALNSPEISLDLVITSDEHRHHRAQYTQEWFDKLGIEVPVVSGHDLGRSKYCICCDLITDPAQEVNTNVLDAMAKVIDANDKTYYVCIAPQSNLAQFTMNFHEFRDKVEIVMMAGGLERYRLGTQRAEYNIYCDISAARLVFFSDNDLRYVIGDVTNHDSLLVKKETPLFQELAKKDDPRVQQLVEGCRAFFTKSKYSGSYMHDPLTVSAVFAPHVKFITKTIDIDDKGIMRWSRLGLHTAVANHVDYAAFWKLFEERMRRSPLDKYRK